MVVDDLDTLNSMYLPNYLTRKWDPPVLFFRISAASTKKRDSITPPPDHPIGHISGRGWSWRTIKRSIPSHIFSSRFHRLFDIGAATRARGARFVAKGQIWGKFEGEFRGGSDIGRNTSPPSTPGALIAPSNRSVSLESDGDKHDRLSFARWNGVSVVGSMGWRRS
jgi:hypothetical protein